MVTTFTHPRSFPTSSEFDVSVNSTQVEVLRTGVADFANFLFDFSLGGASVSIKRHCTPIGRYALRPSSRAIVSEAVGDTLSFTLKSPEKLVVEIDGAPPLFLWANPPETEPPPQPDAPGVHYFSAGQIYEVGLITLNSSEILYIEGGAVVQGRIEAKNASGLTIRGHGILDGSYFSTEQGNMVPSIFLERCRNVVVKDITMVNPSGWMLVPGACEEVEITNLKQIGEVMCSDGIDVVGSKHVRIRDCFLRNNDDCVVVKAFFVGQNNLTGVKADLQECPEDILVEHCTFLNATCGNAMEIGHELSVERVSGITFRDIDVLSVHGTGAVFSIHNNDRAIVENVLFENIRIEHCYDKFIDFRISKSRYSSDEERGQIRNVTMRNIDWMRSIYSPGYTVSLIGGWDEAHRVENVLLDNITINGRMLEHLDELEIHTRHCKGLRLVQQTEPPSTP